MANGRPTPVRDAAVSAVAAMVIGATSLILYAHRVYWALLLIALGVGVFLLVLLHHPSRFYRLVVWACIGLLSVMVGIPAIHFSGVLGRIAVVELVIESVGTGGVIALSSLCCVALGVSARIDSLRERRAREGAEPRSVENTSVSMRVEIPGRAINSPMVGQAQTVQITYASGSEVSDTKQVKQITPKDFLLSNTREPPQATNPATLLNARYEVVPFFEEARAAELTDLKAWCDDDRLATSVRLFYGPGGTGKTRLFIEWAKHLRDQGWYAGFLPEQGDDDQVESLLQTDQPALVVLDYAECRATLFDFLKRIAARPSEQVQRLRLVLLARDVADWWQSLLQRDEAVRHLLVQAEPVLIAPVALEGPLRRQIWEHACGAFASRLQKPVPHGGIDRENERFGRILYLHMSALAAVEGLTTKAESLIDEIAAHERRFWAKRYEEQFGKDDFEAGDFDKRCRRLVAAVTLQGGATSRDAAEALNRRVEGPGPRYQHLIPFLRSLYPGRGQVAQDRYLSGLEPDLLGEELVWSVLRDPENKPQLFAEQVFADVTNTSLCAGLVLLGRIASYDPTVAEPCLARALNVDVPGRARPAFQAALALGTHSAFSPLGLILARALEREGTLDHAVEFDPLVPKHTVSLRELAVWTGQRILGFLSTESL